MENNQKVLTETPEKVLLNPEEPVLFKSILCTAQGSNCWKILDWTLDDFADKCEGLKLPFRVGKNLQTAVNSHLSLYKLLNFVKSASKSIHFLNFLASTMGS